MFSAQTRCVCGIYAIFCEHEHVCVCVCGRHTLLHIINRMKTATITEQQPRLKTRITVFPDSRQNVCKWEIVYGAFTRSIASIRVCEYLAKIERSTAAAATAMAEPSAKEYSFDAHSKQRYEKKLLLASNAKLSTIHFKCSHSLNIQFI